MTRPAMVATDLDGTIVAADGRIGDRTVRVLTEIDALGVPVVFVTGRPPRWMSEVAERTGLTGLAICANGAVVYDLHEERVVQHFPLSAEVGLALAGRLRAAHPDLGFAVETLDGFAHEPSYQPRWDVGASRQVAPLEEIYGSMPVVKLLARHEQLDADELLQAAREVVGDLAELTHSSTSGLLEISAAGVSKGATLAQLAADWGIDASQVVAFGDMPNDLPMLAWAGQPYAVEGAHPDVLAAVPGRARPAEDDGVARVLEELFELSAS